MKYRVRESYLIIDFLQTSVLEKSKIEPHKFKKQSILTNFNKKVRRTKIRGSLCNVQLRNFAFLTKSCSVSVANDFFSGKLKEVEKKIFEFSGSFLGTANKTLI